MDINDKKYIIEIEGQQYDMRNYDDRIILMSKGYLEDDNKKEINVCPIIPDDKQLNSTTVIVTSKKGSDIAMPTYKVALSRGEYIVLSTLLDKKYSTFSSNNQNCRILLREDYLKNKKEMIASCGGEGKKPMSARTWDRNFRSMIDCGIIEEVKNSNGKIYKYHIYNKNECGKEFVLIESEILRQLKKVYKSNALKIYCIIRFCCYNKLTKKYDLRKKIELDYICEKMGLTESSRQQISPILDELQGANYIKRYKMKKMASNGEYQITYYEYEIVPFEEWRKARTPIEE